MGEWTFPTLLQFFDAIVKEYAQENGITQASMRAVVSPDNYADEYYRETVNAIEAGSVPAYRVWKTWPTRFREDIFRLWKVRTDDTVAKLFLDYTERGTGTDRSGRDCEQTVSYDYELENMNT